MTSSPEPRNRILRHIDDMGAFRAEYSPNATYGFQVFSLWFRGGCILIMAVIAVSGGRWMLDNARNANPGEIPDIFYPLVWGMMTVIPVAILLVLIYAVRCFRKYPLVYGLFENGFVVVCRNKSYRKIFWNSISRIRVKKQGKKKPRILGIAMEIS